MNIKGKLLLPLLLLVALWAGCRPKNDWPRVSKTFYSVHRDGDRMLVDTTVVLRIVDGEVVVDDRDPRRTQVFRISHLGFYEGQIYIEYDRRSDYGSYRRGEPEWNKQFATIFDDYLILNRHLDLPMYYYEYAQSDERFFVIDSTEVVGSGFGFYRFPDQDQGLNDPAYYNEHDVWLAEGRRKQEVIFRLADTASYRKLTADQLDEAIGYRITGSQESRPHIRLPISPEHRDFDLYVTLTESDYGPYNLLNVVKAGEMTEYLVIDQLQEHSAWDNDGQWMEGYRVEGDFEVYADYSVKETVRTDTVGATRIEINTYFLDTDGQYRDMFTYGHGQLMRTMDWSGMPDGPEVQAVRDFLMWYHRSHEAIDTLSLIDYHEKYYAVDRQACRAFVDRLAESDRVSPDYLARWEAYFEKYDSYFQKEQVDDGPPPGFDHDLILQTQEPRQALAVIPQDLIVTKLIRRGEDRAEVTVDLWTSRITYTLSRREDRWLIDGQE